MDGPVPGEDRYSALHQAIWRMISSRKDKFGQHVIEPPAFVPVEEGYSDSALGDNFPVMQHLPRILDIARSHGFRDVADAFAGVAPQLPWSQNPRYVADPAKQALLEGYAYASLSGPEGPIKCMAPRGGFYVMGPDVHYPSHNHAPREVYFLMTPGVQWRLDDGEWFDTEPGDLIYHAPWQAHAMRTGGAPALAYVAWLEPGSRLEIGWTEPDN